MHKRIAFPKSTLNTIPDLVTLTFATFDSESRSYMHSHNVAEIMFIVSGDGYLNTLDESYPLKRGTILLINPHILHTETQKTGKPSLEYYVLAISNIRFSDADLPVEFGESVDPGRVIRIDSMQDSYSELIGLLDTMQYEMDKNEPYGANVILSCLMLFLSNLIRHAGITLSYPTAQTPSRSSIVEYVKNYIDSYYNTDFKIQDIADKISVSYSLLYHKFVQEIGISPIEYKLNRQMEEAKTMLKSSDFSVTQISTMSGFNSLAYFIRLFRERTGMTPKNFRKKETN